LASRPWWSRGFICSCPRESVRFSSPRPETPTPHAHHPLFHHTLRDLASHSATITGVEIRPCARRSPSVLMIFSVDPAIDKWMNSQGYGPPSSWRDGYRRSSSPQRPTMTSRRQGLPSTGLHFLGASRNFTDAGHAASKRQYEYAMPHAFDCPSPPVGRRRRFSG
jgi:hypothetical protein